MKTMEAIINMAGTPDWKELLPLSQAALHILLILVLAWMLLRLSAKAIWMLQVYSTHHTDNNLEGLKRIETLSRVFRYTSSVVIYVVAGMVILSELGVSIAPILATAGVLGIAVGIEIPYPHMTIYPGQAKDGSAPFLHIASRSESAKSDTD